jgi:hypothetical protein
LSPSFGHTCAARARTAALLLLVGLLLAMVPLGTASAATNSSSVSAPSSPQLSLGFSPSTLSPVSGGVPVYTVGDTIWALSSYNSTVSVSVTSADSRVVVGTVMNPHVITPLYTFKASDTDGVWNLTVGVPQGVAPTAPVSVRFVNLADHPVSLSPLLYSLDGGNMSISTQANLGDSYDQEVCAAGSAGVSLALPRDMNESGSIALNPGSPFGITVHGQVNESFSFWFELYHPYALDVISANSLVANDLLAAELQPVTFAQSVAFNSTVSANTTLTLNVPLREGRYEMRAYFQNSTNLEVVQSRVLVLNDSSWVSLSSSCLPQTVQSQNISYSASLTHGEASWPRTLYLMYRTFGVEAVASYPVNANLSSVNFVASPWNASLQDLTVNVFPAPGITQTSQDGSSLFVLASQYPVKLSYSLDIGGGVGLVTGSVTVNGRDSVLTNTISLAELTVHVLSDQSSPGTLDVTGPQGLSISTGAVGSNDTSSFLLPTGTYTVTATQAGSTESAQVGLTDGLASAVTLNFNTFLTFEIILVVTAVMAAVANLAIWVFSSRGLRGRMARAQKVA